MIRADSFLLHEKSKTPPEEGGVFTSLDGLRRSRTLSQLNKYTSHGPASCLRCNAWSQITRRRWSSAERHSRMSST
ncbi:hypothetical protein EIY72_06260 [Pseudomonas vancouverensis]|uniref:Uncharacterized protein n=1 Tax=Pseudomonas vancouverensis TaxID=95300 RepID=A0A4V2XA67_PSEVA|nr:hypothetical protein F7R09_09490 [Pseudomonas vancouverensis]TDB66465.1 hypothetical protein EIY72_06260 [Pseudomonas vancouverensis]